MSTEHFVKVYGFTANQLDVVKRLAREAGMSISKYCYLVLDREIMSHVKRADTTVERERLFYGDELLAEGDVEDEL